MSRFGLTHTLQNLANYNGNKRLINTKCKYFVIITGYTSISKRIYWYYKQAIYGLLYQVRIIDRLWGDEARAIIKYQYYGDAYIHAECYHFLDYLANNVRIYVDLIADDIRILCNGAQTYIGSGVIDQTIFNEIMNENIYVMVQKTLQVIPEIKAKYC